MSQQDIRRAFDKALVSISGGLGSSKTAFENVSFTPQQKQPYQRVKLTPVEVANPTFGDDYHREEGWYVVTLSYPADEGVGKAVAQAEIIKAFFKRGTTFYEGNSRVKVFRTPSIYGGVVVGGRYELAIRIRYYSEECTF